MKKKKSIKPAFQGAVTKGLIILPEWGEKILADHPEDRKTLEMRTKGTKERGWCALIFSGTGRIHGLINITDSSGPYDNKQLGRLAGKHHVPVESFEGPDYKWRHAWHIGGIVKFEKPIPYQHKSGAVIWLSLTPTDQKAVARARDKALDMERIKEAAKIIGNAAKPK
jgi:hypothetical protein